MAPLAVHMSYTLDVGLLVMKNCHVMFPRHTELLVHTHEVGSQTLAEATSAMVMSMAFSNDGILYIHTYVRTYIHTYIHTCMHACIHTYIHTYTLY